MAQATPISRSRFRLWGNLPYDAASNTGIDIDWEYPAACGLQGGSPEDTANFTALLAEFRRQLNEQAALDGNEYLLTIAAPAVMGLGTL
jgi:GH18 family chitinase